MKCMHNVSWNSMIQPASGKKGISIVCAGTHAFRNFLRDRREDRPARWVYFGPDIFLEKTVEADLGGRFRKIRIGEALQNTAHRTRGELVDYVGVLSAGRRNDCWWLTTLSEKSPSSSRLFLHLCYLKLGMDLLQKGEEPLLIVCESRPLAESFRLNLSKHPEYSVTWYDSGADSVRLNIKNAVAILSEKTWFLARYSGRLLAARLCSLLRKRDDARKFSGGCTVIHSWADARSTATPGTYRDVYFGDLGESLTRKGIGVCYLLDVIPTIWYPRLVHAALKNPACFLLMEDFISWRDIIASIRRVWDLPRQIRDIPFFDGSDISPIVAEELRNERFTSIGEHAFLCYRSCKRMANHLAVKNFIFTYENQACQKLFVLAFRKCSPETTLTGYVHTYAIPMYTLYSISEKEKDIMPVPDKIIVNGEQSKRVLVESGYPESRVFTGGALRYTYLRSELPARPAGEDTFTVLAAASVNTNEAVELIEKCLGAFSGRPGFTIVIKTHPTLPFRRISKYFPVLPENAVVSENPVQDLLGHSDLVLFTSSTVAIEALALGIPVIHVKSDHTIDMNFFDGEAAIPSFSDPREIARAGEQILRQREKPSREESERLVSAYFMPVDDAVIDIFAALK